MKELKDIVTKIDDCLEEFRLPPYYNDPSFHVSVCWAVGDVKSNIPKDVLSDLQVLYTVLRQMPNVPTTHLLCCPHHVKNWVVVREPGGGGSGGLLRQERLRFRAEILPPKHPILNQGGVSTKFLHILAFNRTLVFWSLKKDLENAV